MRIILLPQTHADVIRSLRINIATKSGFYLILSRWNTLPPSFKTERHQSILSIEFIITKFIGPPAHQKQRGHVSITASTSHRHRLFEVTAKSRDRWSD